MVSQGLNGNKLRIMMTGLLLPPLLGLLLSSTPSVGSLRLPYFHSSFILSVGTVQSPNNYLVPAATANGSQVNLGL
jgi:hypothetical protein